MVETREMNTRKRKTAEKPPAPLSDAHVIEALAARETPDSFNNIAYSFSAFLKDNLPSICLPTIPRFSAVNESDQLCVLSE